MADIYMHSRMAEDVIKNIEYAFNKKIVSNAAQGPDPLYYNFFSKDHPEYRKYADAMHRKDTDLLLKIMTNYVKENLTADSYSFLVGFICHYALDVKIHPYVYNHVGVYKKDDKRTHEWRGLHLKFERSIDAVLIEEDTGIKPRKMNLNTKYFPLRSPSPEIMKIWDHVLKEVYDKDNGGVMYSISTVEMRKNIKRFIKDKRGIKKLIFKFIDLINKKHDMFFQDMSMFNHIEKYDFLNKEKHTWYHPVTNEEYNYSVMELYDQAVTFATEMIDSVGQYVLEDEDIDLSKVFTNLSYNTGLNCDHPGVMQYFNIYRK
ncbi:MAG: hypothetical protein KQ78_01333 [Candidatus Izimaplasma bacterium HR2]|nr:MAG: hypothetical protein KQ78_01333 [Candidatus Izimaplasma bacterium HR2]